MSFIFGRKSREKLVGVHSDLILVVGRAIMYSDYDFAISEGPRAMERQWKLYNAGRTRTLLSKHLRNPNDGLAHAVDVVAVGDLDKDGDCDAQDLERTWDREIYTAIADAVRRAAKELGIPIRWGGTFKDFFDGPHFELKGES